MKAVLLCLALFAGAGALVLLVWMRSLNQVPPDELRYADQAAVFRQLSALANDLGRLNAGETNVPLPRYERTQIAGRFEHLGDDNHERQEFFENQLLLAQRTRHAHHTLAALAASLCGTISLLALALATIPRRRPSTLNPQPSTR